MIWLHYDQLEQIGMNLSSASFVSLACESCVTMTATYSTYTRRRCLGPQLF